MNSATGFASFLQSQDGIALVHGPLVFSCAPPTDRGVFGASDLATPFSRQPVSCTGTKGPVLTEHEGIGGHYVLLMTYRRLGKAGFWLLYSRFQLK